MRPSATPTGKPAARRRTYKLVTLTFVLLSLALTLPAGASAFISTGDGGWVWQNPLPQGNRLNGVDFPDATHGWAVGDSGAILATTNGGATWSAQSSGSTADLRSVAFSDATHGWAVGWDYVTYTAVILATTNGGATWSAQSSGSTKWLEGVALSSRRGA